MDTYSLYAITTTAEEGWWVMFLLVGEKTDAELTEIRNSLEVEELKLTAELSRVMDSIRTIKREQHRRFRALMEKK